MLLQGRDGSEEIAKGAGLSDVSDSETQEHSEVRKGIEGPGQNQCGAPKARLTLTSAPLFPQLELEE